MSRKDAIKKEKHFLGKDLHMKVRDIMFHKIDIVQ